MRELKLDRETAPVITIETVIVPKVRMSMGMDDQLFVVSVVEKTDLVASSDPVTFTNAS
jgi:hypothetical protein